MDEVDSLNEKASDDWRRINEWKSERLKSCAANNDSIVSAMIKIVAYDNVENDKENRKIELFAISIIH